MRTDSRADDTAAAIDAAPFGRTQARVVLLCGIVAMLDGFDTQAIAFVAPVVAAQWGLAASAFGPVFGAGLGGLMVGALLFGPLADRYGRRNVILLTTLLFAVLTLATAWASTLPQLLLLRFLTGIGLGGAMPNIIALTAEYSPARMRATMVSLMFCGFPLGAVAGGLVASRMIPALGWESTFWLGGILPLLLLPVLHAWLPESIRFLAGRGKPESVLRGMLAPIVGDERAARVRFEAPSAKPAGVPLARLLVKGQGARTAALWVVFFSNLLLLYFLVNWLPSLLRQAGVALDKAIVSTALLNLGGIVGALCFARAIDRLGPYFILIAAYVAAAAATFAIGRSTGAGFGELMVMVFAAGFCVIGAQISINAIAANSYPTEVRATGVGWALGVGRVGSIIGPVVGGVLVGAGLATAQLFGIAALPALLAAAAVAALWAMQRGPAVETPELAVGEVAK